MSWLPLRLPHCVNSADIVATQFASWGRSGAGSRCHIEALAWGDHHTPCDVDFITPIHVNLSPGVDEVRWGVEYVRHDQ